MAAQLSALVVDDSRAQRSIMRRLLAAHDISTADAANGSEALELLHAGHEPDVVLLDWNMPVMDGHAFLEELRADRAYDRLKVVVVTSEASFHTVSSALSAGADEYVMKPCGPEALLEKLAMVGVVPDRSLARGAIARPSTAVHPLDADEVSPHPANR